MGERVKWDWSRIGVFITSLPVQFRRWDIYLNILILVVQLSLDYSDARRTRCSLGCRRRIDLWVGKRGWGWWTLAQRLQWCILSSPESFMHNTQKGQILWKQLYEDYIHCLLIIRRLNHNLTSGNIIVVYLNSINSINSINRSRTSNTSKTSKTSKTSNASKTATPAAHQLH